MFQKGYKNQNRQMQGEEKLQIVNNTSDCIFIASHFTVKIFMVGVFFRFVQANIYRNISITWERQKDC